MLDSEEAGPSILDRVWEALREMSPKLNRMIEVREKVLQLLKEKGEGEVKLLDMVTLLSLPDHLKRTAMAMLALTAALEVGSVAMRVSGMMLAVSMGT